MSAPKIRPLHGQRVLMGMRHALTTPPRSRGRFSSSVHCRRRSLLVTVEPAPYNRIDRLGTEWNCLLAVLMTVVE
jgi:hypothetical protein